MQKTDIERVKNDDGSRGFTVNPVRGKCRHACWYCYEEDRRKRFKEPEAMSWHPEALDWIRRRKKPATMFLGSTYDLFGAWVPDAYLQEIYRTAIESRQHRIIFLTKNAELAWWEPMRYHNIWFGGTVTSAEDKDNGTSAGGFYLCRKAFISFEPLLGDVFKYGPLTMHRNIKWFIIGALTSRGKIVPPARGGTRVEWVRPIIDLADRHGIPVFLKDNLLKLHPELPRRQEVPWVASAEARKERRQSNGRHTDRQDY